MKLFLTSAYDHHPSLDALLALAPATVDSPHELWSVAEEADAILFVENTHFDDLRWTRLLRHPLIKQFRGKSFVYNEADKPWDVVAGLYCSMHPRHFVADRHMPFPYIKLPCQPAAYEPATEAAQRWLYSFMGAMSHPCRRSIMQLDDPEAMLRNTSDFDVWHAEGDELERRSREFATSLTGSAFVLCPRGIGTSSMRLFEALAAGRAPVIIADDWLAPPHVDWSFAIRVPERRIHTIPDVLRAHADEAVERGDAARDAWLAHYSPERLFHTVGESLDCLLEGKRGGRRPPYSFGLRKWYVSGEAATRDAIRRLRRAA